MTLDLTARARIHAFETQIRDAQVPGIVELAPCIRSTMVGIVNFFAQTFSKRPIVRFITITI